MVEHPLVGDVGAVVEREADGLAVAVLGDGERAARAEDHALAEGQAVPGVVVDPLSERAVGEGDQPEDGVLAGGLDGWRQVGRPLLVEAAGTGGLADHARLLEEAGLAEGADGVAEVVLQDVGVVDAGVERDGAGQLLVPPGGDDDAYRARGRRSP